MARSLLLSLLPLVALASLHEATLDFAARPVVAPIILPPSLTAPFSPDTLARVLGDLPVRPKAGGRLEHTLPLSFPGLSEIASALRPGARLVFASILTALPVDASTPHQAFHADDADDASAVRAIVYLTDVNSADGGALELQASGPVLGPAGTATVYSASTSLPPRPRQQRRGGCPPRAGPRVVHVEQAGDYDWVQCLSHQ